MTAGDDGGFRPHPGDPWHPGWSDDPGDSPAQDVDAVAPKRSRKDKPSKKPKQKDAKRPKPAKKRSGRRGSKDEAPEIDPERAFDPTTTAFDMPDALADGPSRKGEDPFGAVLEREGRSLRRPAASEAPPPAWTVDEAPADDQVLPVEQPSWIGQATASDTQIEALSFDDLADPGSSPESEPVGEQVGEEPPAPIADTHDTEPEGTEPEPQPVPAPADVDVGDLLEDGADSEFVGTYGVAGPEAYDTLGGDEASTGELDDWDAFITGGSGASAGGRPADDIAQEEPEKRGRFRRKKSDDAVIDDGYIGSVSDVASEEPSDEAPAAAAAATGFAAPTEALGDEEIFDDWVAGSDSPAKKRKGLFRRNRGGADADVGFDDVLDESADDGWDDGFESAAPAPYRPFAAPPSGVVDEPAEPAWVAPHQDPVGAGSPQWVDDAADDVEEDIVVLAAEAPIDAVDADVLSEADPAPDVEAAVYEALAVLAGDTIAAPDLTVAPDSVSLDDVVAPPSSVDGTPGVGSVEPVGDDESVEVEAEAPDWEGDPGRVPASWFAEIDEDEVVPPPAADTPETEWPDEAAPVVAGGDVPYLAGRIDAPSQEPVEDEADELGLVAPQAGWPDEAAPVVGADDVPYVAGAVDGPLQEWDEDEDWSAEETPAAAPGAMGVIPVESDTDLFDVEAISPPRQPEPISPPLMPEVPAGYEPWGDAVEEVLGAGRTDDDLDDGTYEYEPMLQGTVPAADVVPAGFERFPGGMEQFQLSEQDLAAELGTGQYEPGWVTRALDSGESGGDAEFDEHIYAGPGTLEHRDLAAAIAEAGYEDTQWQALSAAMPGMETGVLGFEDVADLGSGGDYVAPVRSSLGPRVATGLILAVLLFGSLLVSSVAFAGFVGLMLMLGLIEFFAALRRSGYLPLTLVGILGGGATLATTWFHGPMALVAGVLLTSMMTFFFYAFSPTRRDALTNGGLTVFGVAWVVATVGFAIPIARAEEYVVLILAIVVVTAAMDIGAFSFGRSWGRSPLAPVLSPNKTTEGLVGGILLTFGAAAAFGFFELGPFDLASALALGAVVAVFAPLGDLAESMVKRSLGIKDMGATLPGHGGVLDRIDAFLFVVPAVWVLYEFVGFLG